jgi:hypothetical protein
MSTRRFNLVGSPLVIEEILTNPYVKFEKDFENPPAGYRDVLVTTDEDNTSKLNQWCDDNDVLCLTWPLDESDLP